MEDEVYSLKPLATNRDIAFDKKATLYVFYLQQGIERKEAFLKLHPQHRDNPNVNQLRYNFENNKYVKTKLKMFHSEIGLVFFSKRMEALNREFEIGMGVHGGSLKTQADALNQFINNTQLPQEKSKLEELKEKELEEKSKLLQGITEVFNKLGQEQVEDVEVINTSKDS